MHDNSLSERGTTNAVLGYAQLLTQYGHSIEIAYNEETPSNNPAVVKKIASEFELVPYRTFSSLRQHQLQYDLAYFIKSGRNDDRYFDKTPSLVHAVFQEYQPHGYKYFYVSEWLSQTMKNRQWRPKNYLAGRQGIENGCVNARKFDFLPHVVDVEQLGQGMRGELGLPPDCFVILRYGGYDTFDIPWAQQALVEIIETNPHVFALMVNTRPFSDHERVIYLTQFTSHLERDRLLGTADLFLHARMRGESFGLSIVEALQARIPVLAWVGGSDRNHTALLSNSNSLYSNRSDLVLKLRAAIQDTSDFQSNDQITRAEQFRSLAVAPSLITLFFDYLG